MSRANPKEKCKICNRPGATFLYRQHYVHLQCAERDYLMTDNGYVTRGWYERDSEDREREITNSTGRKYPHDYRSPDADD